MVYNWNKKDYIAYETIFTIYRFLGFLEYFGYWFITISVIHLAYFVVFLIDVYWKESVDTASNK